MQDEQIFSNILSSLTGSVPSSVLAPTAAARACDALRRQIISFELPPDTIISRSELAKEFGLSQTPVRDALQKLEAEGLVKIYPQSKTIVTRIDPGQIAEAVFLRRAIEIQIVRHLAESITPETLEQLRTIVSLQSTAAKQENAIGAFQDLDEAFHKTMIAAVGFPNLHHLIQSKSGHLNRLRYLDMWDKKKINRILKDHKVIIEALSERNPDGAADAIREHLGQTIGKLPELHEANKEYFLEN